FAGLGAKNLIAETECLLNIFEFDIARRATRMHAHFVQFVRKVGKNLSIFYHPGENLIIFSRKNLLIAVALVNFGLCANRWMLQAVLTASESGCNVFMCERKIGSIDH